MQFSESWLRQYVNPALDSGALGHAMTMAGLEVEEQHSVAPAFTKIVIAQILSAEQHPDADRLRVCKVDAGTGQELQIVCGAPNARAGIKIPCAMVGAELPPAEAGGKPFMIKVGKLRGVESQGMLCSGRELGLGDDHEGILELSADAPVGQDIREYLDLDDQIFVIKHKHSAGREGTIRNSNFRSSDSSLWHWPRCPIGIIPLYIPRWIDSLFKLTCLFDLWQCQSVFEEQPFNRHRTVRRIGYCSRSGRGGSLPLIPLLSFVRYLT